MQTMGMQQGRLECVFTEEIEDPDTIDTYDILQDGCQCTCARHYL